MIKSLERVNDWVKGHRWVYAVAAVVGGAIGLRVQAITPPDTFRYIWGGWAILAILAIGYFLFIKEGK